MADKTYRMTFTQSDQTKQSVDFVVPQGEAGVGIETITQSPSALDGGINTITIKKTDGTSTLFVIRNGSKGSRGPGILKVTTAPSSYTTTVNGLTPKYRIALSTVKTQSNVTEVLVGDIIAYSYYQYHVGYVDASYAYILTTRVSLRGATGTAGAAGANGVDGYTPVRGTDYWTDADQESIVQQVIAAMGTPVFGMVDENNNIILTGNLADGTYTLKYENAEGAQTVVGSLITSTFVNQISISTDTDGSIYNGTGYKESSRCSSDGSISAITSGTNPAFTTGFIPCRQGDIVKLKNCYIHAHGTNATYEAIYGNGAYGLRCGLYDASKTTLCVFSWGNLSQGGDTDKITYVQNGSNYKLTEFTIAYADVSYIRLTLAADVDNGYTAADAIVTIDEGASNSTPAYTNLIPLSTDIDGSIYNGSGWMAQQRINSSGEVVTNGDYASTDGSATNVTGFIPVSNGDIIRGSSGILVENVASSYTRIAWYDSEKNYISYTSLVGQSNSDGSFEHTVSINNVAYFRLAATGVDDDAVITVNEEITETAPAYTNVIPLSTDVNGDPYNGGLGYREGYRYSSSGGGDVTGSGLYVTGYIKCKDSDTLYFKNVGMNKDAGISNGCNMYRFSTLSVTSSSSSDASLLTSYHSAQWDDNGDILRANVTDSPTGVDVWLRFNTTYLGPDSVITLNEPIE